LESLQKNRLLSAALALLLLPVGASALSIPVAWDGNLSSTVAGSCLDHAGLGCTWKPRDPLIDPTTGAALDPPVSAAIDRPAWIRSAIYTTSNFVYDPGLLFLSSKVDGSAESFNGNNGFTLYNASGESPLNVIGQDIRRGYWSYTGPDVLSYLVLKTAKWGYVWDIEQLLLSGSNDGDPTTPLVGYWELDSWYAVANAGKNKVKPTAMSHISLYSQVTQEARRIPAPSSLVMLLGFLPLLGFRRRKRHTAIR